MADTAPSLWSSYPFHISLINCVTICIYRIISILVYYLLSVYLVILVNVHEVVTRVLINFTGVEKLWQSWDWLHEREREREREASRSKFGLGLELDGRKSEICAYTKNVNNHHHDIFVAEDSLENYCLLEILGNEMECGKRKLAEIHMVWTDK